MPKFGQQRRFLGLKQEETLRTYSGKNDFGETARVDLK